jgi:hypothetical protein
MGSRHPHAAGQVFADLAEGDALDVGAPMKAWLMIVASMLSWISGCRPASTSRWKWAG